MRHPLNNFTIASHFKSPARPNHLGTDYVSPDPYVYAIEDGKIERRFDTISGWGVNLLAGGRKWECIHLFEAGRAPNGANVKEGDKIGRWGETKVANVTGPHLHLGLQINEGPQLDGYAYIEEHEDMACNPTAKDVNDYFVTYLGKSPTAAQVAGYIKKPWQELASDIAGTLKNELTADAIPLVSGKKYIAP